jgi:hypothetical protein
MLDLHEMAADEPEKPPKTGLEDWQIKDAERLRALFTERATVSQAKFGELYGIGTQGMVWQYLNARRPLNPKAAKGFADGLQLTIADISPRLAALIESIASTASASGERPAELIEKCLNMTAAEWDQMLDFAEFLLSKRKSRQ